jgi:thiol-disulfide isomerase/thioredoxin
MHAICRWLGGAVLGLSVLSSVVGQTQDVGPAKVDFKVVKYDQVAQEVLKNRGKVVVVDAWGIYCPPCIKGLPHLIAMSKKYADKGLVAITLHVDPPFDAETKAQVPKILGRLNATTINLVLDEPSEVWQQKLHTSFIPAVFVFSREGKWTQFDGAKYEPIEKMYEAIDQLVIKLLDQK